MKKSKSLSRKLRAGIAIGALAFAGASTPTVLANQPYYSGGGISHVLLISVDGMHALDYLNCASGGYCPNLAALGSDGINYLRVRPRSPRIHFPG